MSTPRVPGKAVAWQKALRLLWAGQSVSLIGDQVTLLALPLTAISLGASAAQVAVLAATATAPFIVLGLPVGVLVARFGLRRSMLFADVVRGLALLSLMLAACFGRLSYPHLLAVAFVLGCAIVFFQVSYQSLTPVLVDDVEQLRSANTRLQASESVAQVGGPALGGVLIGALGAVRALTVDAASYAVSVATLVALRAPGDRPVHATGSVVAQVRAGVRYVGRAPALRGVLWSSVWFNTGMSGYQALLVVFAVRTLGLSPSTLGLAVGLGGLGVPIGLLLSGPVERRLGMRVVLTASAALSAAGILVAGAAAGSFAAVLIGAGSFVTALGGGAWGVAALTVRQRLSAPQHRAMATAVFRWATYSVLPLGALLAGLTASTLGVRAAVLIFGVVAQLCVVPLLRAPLPDFRQDNSSTGRQHDQHRRHHRQHPARPGGRPYRQVGGWSSASPAGDTRRPHRPRGDRVAVPRRGAGRDHRDLPQGTHPRLERPSGGAGRGRAGHVGVQQLLSSAPEERAGLPVPRVAAQAGGHRRVRRHVLGYPGRARADAGGDAPRDDSGRLDEHPVPGDPGRRRRGPPDRA
jgi:MFS family permease